MHAPLRVLDPILTTAAITVAHGYMIYDQLFGLDADLKPRPQMVDTWTVSDDELTYRFVLRDGLAFSTGRPVLAKDVVAAEICDNIMVMHRGKVVERGPTAEIFAKPSHEYTRSLFDASPGRNWDFGEALAFMEREPVPAGS